MSNNLPKWDLSDLYPQAKLECLEEDFSKLDELVGDFVNNYQDKIKLCADSDLLSNAIASYEVIDDLSGTLIAFAYLCYAQDRDKAPLLQAVQQRLTVISTRLNFFPIEVNAIDAKALNGFIASSTALAKYKPWLDKIRKTKPHQLSTKQEQVADIKNLTGYDAWVRLFDETITRLRFPLDDQELNEP